MKEILKVTNIPVKVYSVECRSFSKHHNAELGYYLLFLE